MSKKSGLAPGTLVHVGEKRTGKVRISVIDYDQSFCEERKVDKIEDCYEYKEKDTITWINIDGVHDLGIIEKIGKKFELHPLVLEDIGDTAQRPQLEDFHDHIFIVLKMLYYNAKKEEIIVEQVSIIFGSNYVISFQEQEGDVFDSIRERLRQGKGRVRKMGADYLAYTLIDAIVDNYFLILESFGEDLEKIEENLASNPGPDVLTVIHRLKRDAILLRKAIWPLREIISGLQRVESSLIKENTLIYFRDVYDHTIQVIDTTEAFRDMVSGMLDIYLSSVSNRMNEVMKVLTIFASIFIPLTFVAGVYGMNFKYMPELEWHWAYFAVLGFMALVGITMVLYFKRKKWF